MSKRAHVREAGPERVASATLWMTSAAVCLGLLGCEPRGSSPPPQWQGQGQPPAGAWQGGPTGPSQPPRGPAPPPPAPQADPVAVVQAAVQTALARDFNAYLQLVHSEEKTNAKQIAGIEGFSWKRFMGQAAWYPDPSGRVVVERQNVEGQDVMLYIRDHFNQGRMPPPMRLRRDPAAQGAWRIAANSL
jgi:hypothetical protein